MAEVIEHDFGKTDREAVRRFCSLMGILENHQADVLADPGKYLNIAAKEVAETRREIFKAWEVVAIARGMTTVEPSDAELQPNIPETIRVDAAEYQALKEVYRRVAKLAGMAA